jgi:hypothetical protein
MEGIAGINCYFNTADADLFLIVQVNENELISKYFPKELRIFYSFVYGIE